MRTNANNMLLFLKGLAMGAADVVPGISGGTVAFITGIYIELVATIKSFDITALKLLKSDGLRAAWHHINGNFLVVLLAGILTSVFSLAQIMHYLLLEHGEPLWSFFSGLIIGSVILLLRQNPPAKISEKLLFVVGVLIAYGISIRGVGRVGDDYVLCRCYRALCNDSARNLWFIHPCSFGTLSCIY
jgi:putative membrane protein